MPAALLVSGAAAAYGAYSNSQAQNKAAKAAKKGAATANEALDTGYAEANPMLVEGYDRAREMVKPSIEGGQQSQSFYNDLMGLNGEAARAEAQRVVASDPMLSGAFLQQLSQSDRAMNAGPVGRYSGANLLAANRVTQQNWGNILGRYQQGAALGQQASQYGAGLEQQRGSDLANFRYGLAQQKAGVATNQYSNLGNIATASANNNNQLLGTIVSGFTPNNQGQSAFGSMGNAASSGWNSMWGAGASPASSPNYAMPSSWGGVGAYPY